MRHIVSMCLCFVVSIRYSVCLLDLQTLRAKKPAEAGFCRIVVLVIERCVSSHRLVIDRNRDILRVLVDHKRFLHCIDVGQRGYICRRRTVHCRYCYLEYLA